MRQAPQDLSSIPPGRIRQARVERIQCLADGQVPSDATINDAVTAPNQTCNNVGCAEFHIWEDCPWELYCSGCVQPGHVASRCRAKCTRCGRKGHTFARCAAVKNIHGNSLRQTKVVELLQRTGSVRRELPDLETRLRREANTIRMKAGVKPLEFPGDNPEEGSLQIADPMGGQQESGRRQPSISALGSGREEGGLVTGTKRRRSPSIDSPKRRARRDGSS